VTRNDTKNRIPIEENMKKPFIVMIVMLGTFLSAYYFTATAGPGQIDRAVSGKIINGYRILPIEKTGTPLHLNVYRGDYIKFQLDPSVEGLSLAIAGLSIQQALSRDIDAAPYFKMKRIGSFAFTLGDVSGHIHVTNYRQEKYAEVSAADAADIIATRSPLILDVRTPGEYKRARLKNSVLIPVQVLQQNLDKLSAYKDREILVYCATGNRSTVASKILIDNGFSRITNLRRGIVDWYKQKYPIVQ
jgi:rhodanese-related sulfurtransferase